VSAAVCPQVRARGKIIILKKWDDPQVNCSFRSQSVPPTPPITFTVPLRYMNVLIFWPKHSHPCSYQNSWCNHPGGAVRAGAKGWLGKTRSMQLHARNRQSALYDSHSLTAHMPGSSHAFSFPPPRWIADSDPYTPGPWIVVAERSQQSLSDSYTASVGSDVQPSSHYRSHRDPLYAKPALVRSHTSFLCVEC